MNQQQSSSAGPRQFEQTAIAKLCASGVPKHIADAFVKVGLPKSGKLQQAKDVVCKMEYKPFFVPVTLKDFQDPLRVGAYVPYEFKSNSAKFHCEFQMTDVEAVKFAKAFPEYDVVAKGKVTNQHAFYANKRYAEAELLVDTVFRDARSSGLDPRSLVDLGGNDTWHAKRGRDYVHCDNPVLSTRDIMRYKVREIFSGSDRSRVCSKTFQQCEHTADYAIAVHSTYDMTPKSIAIAMEQRKIKKFYGVLNYIPGIENKPAGQYEADGMTMDLHKDGKSPSYVLCGFKHDPSLKYKHEIRVLRRYLFISKRYDIIDLEGNPVNYTYKIESVRGNSIIFSIAKTDILLSLNTSVWSSPTRKSYFISLRALGLEELEVDAEMFDRLVLQAASARNMSDFDILSLFRYGKSLRQRVSINGVVLSSGFLHTPQELTYAVIAAYATAAAFRVESGAFFARASGQIINRRSQGFIRDVIYITEKVVLEALLALPKALVWVTGMKAISDAIGRLVSDGRHVEVVVHKPHLDRGLVYNPSMFTRRLVVDRVKMDISKGVKPTLRSLFYGLSSTPIEIHLEGKPLVMVSKGLVPYDPGELPAKTLTSVTYTLKKYDSDFSVGWIEKARSYYYKQAIDNIRGGKFDYQMSVMSNGDRIVRHGVTNAFGARELGRSDMSFVGNRQKYAVFRGVGHRIVKLNPPSVYSSKQCIGFYLFYEGRMSEYAAANIGVTTKDFSPTPSDSGGLAEPQVSDVGWSDVTDVESASSVLRFSTQDEADAFMATDQAVEGHYMSGALDGDMPHTPPHDDIDQYIRDYEPVVPDIPDVVDESTVDGAELQVPTVESGLVTGSGEVVQDDPDTVSSDDVLVGRNAINELIDVSDRSTRVALATSASMINLAYAVSKGEATASRFKSVAQGHPGSITLVTVRDTGDILEYGTDSPVEHMAVSDGQTVYDINTNPPPPGTYVTSEVLRVFTGAAIKRSLQMAIEIPYVCEVTCVNGVAGSGKSYYIEHNARLGDVVLCETRESLADLYTGLRKQISGWNDAAYTVDSFLINRQSRQCQVLYVDEAFRLHAGKMFALMKLLRPRRVVCFGDDKQIPALPFVPEYEFIYNDFPYSRIELKRDTWRCPADICFALSAQEYYGFTMLTHNPIIRSVSGPTFYRHGMFQAKPDGHALLVYEKDLAHELRASGLRDVYTVGQAQGKTFDHVMLYRSSSNGKQIYYDRFQALVATTRHRKSFLYVSVCPAETDISAVAKLLAYIKGGASELVLSHHLCQGVKPAANYTALEDRAPESPDHRSQVTSDDIDVASGASDWADIVGEEFL